MCGVIGVCAHEPVGQMLYDGLTMLQHRGQDAAGIVTLKDDRLYLRKDNGMVRDVFLNKHMVRLVGNFGIGMFAIRPQAHQARQKLSLCTLILPMALPWHTTAT